MITRINVSWHNSHLCLLWLGETHFHISQNCLFIILFNISEHQLLHIKAIQFGSEKRWPTLFGVWTNLTHLPLVPHICVSESVSIGSDNGLSPIWRQAIIRTSAGLLSIRPLGANFSENLIKMQNFSFMKIHPKTSSVKWRPFCPGGDELTYQGHQMW